MKTKAAEKVITLHYRRGFARLGKAAWATAVLVALASCSSGQRDPANGLTVLLYSSPITLHPRNAMDAIGQQIGALLFRGLTRLDHDLVERGDLAESWKVAENGMQYTFRIREGWKDHAGEPITAAQIAGCLENYRDSRHAPAFPSWKSAEARGADVMIKLTAPDPYLPRNLSLIRYFRGEGEMSPCTETKPGQSLIGSGEYRPRRWEAAPEHELLIEPLDPARRNLKLVFVTSDTARTIKILRGEVDVVLNALSLPRWRWFEEKHGDRFRLLERGATTVSYLIFNLRDPILAKKEVRRAIAMSIDRGAWVEHKMFRFGAVAPSILHPMLSESLPTNIEYDPAAAEAILDAAGHPRGKNGVRFELRYRCSSFREATEQALGLQNFLGKIGVALKLDVVEPAVWAESVKRGAYQLTASRFVGVSDGGIFNRILKTGQSLNRSGYSDPEMDRLLDQVHSQWDPAKRKEALHAVQRKMAEELPYFPLWYWSNGVLIRKDLQGLEPSRISLSGALEPLTLLR